MIQRIQTVFLFLAAICMALLFWNPMSFMSISGVDASSLSNVMLQDGVFATEDHVILLVLVLIGILLPAIIIFLFNNRKLQMRLGRISIALVVMIVALTVILFFQAYADLPNGTMITVEYGYVAPVLAILFLVLAVRSIQKDEKLVRSADRLR